MADYIDRRSKTRFVLPFAVSAEDRVKAFTKHMEIAAIFTIAESGRKKGEGHILKKPDEKLVFIAEACYPIWLISWGGATLLFDGLGITSHTLSCDMVPDIRAFNKDIRSAKRCEAYSAFLSRNVTYFKDFVGKEEKTVEGLIASPDFIQDFRVYLSGAKETEKPLVAKTVLSPIVKESEISASVKELSELEAKINGDIKNLDASMKLLSNTTNERVKAVRKQIKEVRRKFAKKIEKVKPRVARRIQQIREKNNKKIASESKRYEKRLRVLHRDQVKLEKMQERLKGQINRCEIRIKSCRRRKNKRSETQWTLKLKRIKKNLQAVERKIKVTVNKIGKLEASKKFETSELRLECDKRVERAAKILRELEASREAEIRVKRQKITSHVPALKDTTSLIINQMNEMVKSKKAALIEFDRISMPRKKKAITLVYLPFYLARYEREANKRYVVFPPSIVSGMGMLTKLKGVFGVARLKAFLELRSKAITVFLNQLVPLIQKDSMFEKEVTEAGIQNSVLRIKESRIGIKRGLEELKNEEWISRSDFQTLGKLLFIYTPSRKRKKKIPRSIGTKAATKRKRNVRKKTKLSSRNLRKAPNPIKKEERTCNTKNANTKLTRQSSSIQPE
jgi:hypothetical protein